MVGNQLTRSRKILLAIIVVFGKVLPMPTTNRQQQADDKKFREAAILLAWQQCLKEHGLQGAMGCAHLAVDAADRLVAERRNSNGRQP